jgi:hypothetical protein
MQRGKDSTAARDGHHSFADLCRVVEGMVWDVGDLERHALRPVVILVMLQNTV